MLPPPLIADLFSPHGAGPFPTADWPTITALITAQPETEQPRLWHAAALHWAELSCQVLHKFVDIDGPKPCPYRVGQSARLIVVSQSLEGVETRWPLFGEWALNGMLPFLAPIAVVPAWPIPAFIVHNIPTFDMYITAHERQDKLLSGGVLLTGKHSMPHVVLLGTLDLLNLRGAFIHELVHALINHFGLPLWLEEGLCSHLGLALLPNHNLVYITDKDVKRNEFWKDHGLETFWQGTCFGHAGAGEAYVLAMHIVRRLLEHGHEQFFRFVRLARKDDAGFAACQEVYGQPLDAVAAALIGRPL